MDRATYVSDLEETQNEVSRLRGLIEVRMRELTALWRKAKPADRLLAVQRLLQIAAINAESAALIDEHNERVRELLGRTRTDKKRLEKLTQEGKTDPDLSHRVLRAELDCQRAEHDRDDVVDRVSGRAALLACGETFLRTAPFTPQEESLKDMTLRVAVLDAHLAELQRLAPRLPSLRTGARFKKKLANGQEKTLIRMLPALTLDDADPSG